MFYKNALACALFLLLFSTPYLFAQENDADESAEDVEELSLLVLELRDPTLKPMLQLQSLLLKTLRIEVIQKLLKHFLHYLL